METPRPPYDPELAVALPVINREIPPTLTADMIPGFRDGQPVDIDEELRSAGIERADVTVRSYDGAEVEVSVLQPPDRELPSAAIYFVHGGGMFMGNRWGGVTGLLPLMVDLGVSVVTVEYRLAPEHPHPAPVEDAYAGIDWLIRDAAPYGIDPRRIVVVGESAGGGIAAGTALLLRDRGHRMPLGLLLSYPMLDDRDATTSTRQFEGVGLWDRASNVLGWSSLLGPAKGGPRVDSYAAPARELDLTGLPPTFIECGSAEVFRDEDVSWATQLWANGGDAELHVWAGGYHSFDAFVPDAPISVAARAARRSWISRIVNRS